MGPKLVRFLLCREICGSVCYNFLPACDTGVLKSMHNTSEIKKSCSTGDLKCA